jgi:hypothetical protein
MHDVIGVVAIKNLGDPLIHTQRLTSRARHEVGIRERIGDGRLLGGELDGEGLSQAPSLGLGPSGRVVRDQPAETFGDTKCAEVAGAVE